MSDEKKWVGGVVVDRIEWADFLDAMVWKQGEHVSMIGPTGSGKTTLVLQLLPKRKYVAVFGSKPKDPVLAGLTKKGFVRVGEFPEHIDTETTPKLLIWPRFRSPSDIARQKNVARDLLNRAFVQGGWTIVIDELRYLSDTLGLKALLELIWMQGRSLELSLVGGTQRPAHVPLMAYDQATHLFFWRDNDETNLKRISGLGGLDSKLIRATVSDLDPFEVLYLNTRTGAMHRTVVANLAA